MIDITKADIMEALDWFDENYGEAIDNEDIPELCNWPDTRPNNINPNPHAYYMAFIYILDNFPQSTIEKYRENLGIPAYISVSQKHGVKSFDFSNYHSKCGKLQDPYEIWMDYPAKIDIDTLIFDISPQGDGIDSLEEMSHYLSDGRKEYNRKIDHIIINQDPNAMRKLFGRMLPATKLTINNFTGIDFDSLPIIANTLELNGFGDLTDDGNNMITGLRFKILDLTGLKREKITLPPSLQLNIATNTDGFGNIQIIKRKDQKIIIKKKFVESIKPLIKTI